MADILEFPSAETQGLAFLQQQVRQLLEAKGADEALQDFAAETVRDIYQRHVSAEDYSFKLGLPASLSDAEADKLKEEVASNLTAIQGANHAVVVRLIAELTLAQVRLFQLQQD